MMDHRRKVIRTLTEAEELRQEIVGRVQRTVQALRECQSEPMAQFKQMKFEQVGCDPLTGDPLNIIEQLNQTFTMLATVEAVKKLLEFHPNAGGFQLALGTCSGRDISSLEPGTVAAEAFAATHPGSNKKLEKEIERLASDPARHRYIFFAAPGFAAGRRRELEEDEIQVYAVEAK